MKLLYSAFHSHLQKPACNFPLLSLSGLLAFFIGLIISDLYTKGSNTVN